MNKINARNLRLMGAFETLKRQLLADPRDDRLDAPLALWTFSTDRRLPMALLNRTLRDLLSTPFSQLQETPGIGEKKLECLIVLLRRAERAVSATKPANGKLPSPSRDPMADDPISRHTSFDPQQLSEITWSGCRETIRRHELGDLKLGQVAPSLEAIPTVIWTVPLSTYLPYRIMELRQLRTHGEKRVRIILEIYYQLHQMLRHVPSPTHLKIRLVPNFVGPLETWVQEQLSREEAPLASQIRTHLGQALIDQLQCDRGQMVREVASQRMGLDGVTESVRAQSRRMGVTRARVYQLLDEAAQVFAVRWPEGRGILRSLHNHLQRLPDAGEALATLEPIQELCFPAKSNGQGEIRAPHHNSGNGHLRMHGPSNSHAARRGEG